MANLKNQNAGGKLNQSNVRKMGRGGGMRGGSRDPYPPGSECECNSNAECGYIYNSNWLCYYGNGQYGMQNFNDGSICEIYNDNYGICQEQQSSGYDPPSGQTEPWHGPWYVKWPYGYETGGRVRPKPTAKRRTKPTAKRRTRPTAKRRSRPTMARGGRVKPVVRHSARTRPTMARGGRAKPTMARGGKIKSAIRRRKRIRSTMTRGRRR